MASHQTVQTVVDSNNTLTYTRISRTYNHLLISIVLHTFLWSRVLQWSHDIVCDVSRDSRHHDVCGSAWRVYGLIKREDINDVWTVFTDNSDQICCTDQTRCHLMYGQSCRSKDACHYFYSFLVFLILWSICGLNICLWPNALLFPWTNNGNMACSALIIIVKSHTPHIKASPYRFQFAFLGKIIIMLWVWKRCQ